MKRYNWNTMSWKNHGSIFPLIIIFLFVSCREQSIDDSLSPIAEFEEQESTLLCWAPNHQDIILQLTSEITKHDHVTIFYNEQNHKLDNIKSLLKEKKIRLKRISFIPFKLENDNIWIRDYGPIFMQNGDENVNVLTFGYPHEANQEYNMFNEQYSAKMRLPFIRSKIFSSGGGREINGRGTIILIEGYEKQINPGFSLEEIENEYRLKMNQKNVIWLKRGIPQDDSFDNGPILDNIYGNGVNWHVDEFCRFADAKTILLAKADPKDLKLDDFYQVIHERLEESYHILKKSKDQDGEPFEIVRVPLAPVIFEQGQFESANIYYTPVTSYLNYVLTNKSVIIPSYFKTGEPELVRKKDDLARKIFQQVFKNREVVMLDASELNYSGGGLHCITLSKPKIRKYKYPNIFKSKRATKS